MSWRRPQLGGDDIYNVPWRSRYYTYVVEPNVSLLFAVRHAMAATTARQAPTGSPQRRGRTCPRNRTSS
jgi:hypothetical protein